MYIYIHIYGPNPNRRHSQSHVHPIPPHPTPPPTNKSSCFVLEPWRSNLRSLRDAVRSARLATTRISRPRLLPRRCGTSNLAPGSAEPGATALTMVADSVDLHELNAKSAGIGAWVLKGAQDATHRIQVRVAEPTEEVPEVGMSPNSRGWRLLSWCCQSTAPKRVARRW